MHLALRHSFPGQLLANGCGWHLLDIFNTAVSISEEGEPTTSEEYAIQLAELVSNSLTDLVCCPPDKTILFSNYSLAEMARYETYQSQ